MITLQGLPPIWKTFNTTLSNNNRLPTFDDLIGKCAQEETRTIYRGRIQKHEEGEPFTLNSTQEKKRKGSGRQSNPRKYSPESKNSKRRLRKYRPHICRRNFN